MLSCLWEGQRTQEVAEETGSQTLTPVNCTGWHQGEGGEGLCLTATL